MSAKIILVLLISIFWCLAENDWISQCAGCKCMWSDGRRTADCSGKSLNRVPANLSPEIRDLDLSNNPMYELEKNALSSELENIQKLKLQNCSIQNVHHLAFAKLGNLIELDLSRNQLTELPERIFKDAIKLRILSLSNNKLRELRGNLFHGMKHLQRVMVSNNEIKVVDVTIFDSGPFLQYVDFGNNKLSHLDVKLVEKLERINSINVQDNPWVCDCRLKGFRDFVMSKNLVTTPTTCAEPKRLRGRLWQELESREFACAPHILEPFADRRVEARTSTNLTIACKVEGDPLPDVDWVSNGRIIDRDPRQTVQKYAIAKGQHLGTIVWSNLTIGNVQYRDRGDYKCVAKNPAGESGRNTTIVVYGDYDGSYGAGTSTSLWPWLLGLGISLFILLVVVAVLICVCCKRKPHQAARSKGSDMNQFADYVSLNGRAEIEKSLITEVNPVVKPPRQYSVSPSITTGGTEVSDVKKTLLEEDAGTNGEDESRSFDFETNPIVKYGNHHPHLELDYDNQLTPDLLAFPTRTTQQISPAGSIASTGIDQSRLLLHQTTNNNNNINHPHSPMHSPMYEGIYRTLPYSRSQSPFTTPLGVPIVTPRAGGYVTIPRRPRASWSSEPIASLPLVADPVYDNLGLRTTATGSSVLSLNRIGKGSEAGTPRTTRPPLPNHHLIPSANSSLCGSISEHDPYEGPMVATLGRPGPDRRKSFARNTPETGSLRGMISHPDSRRESTASLLPATPDSKPVKIPPRPPPKPQKRTSTGPLFEDEGEDGTEV